MKDFYEEADTSVESEVEQVQDDSQINDEEDSMIDESSALIDESLYKDSETISSSTWEKRWLRDHRRSLSMISSN